MLRKYAITTIMTVVLILFCGCHIYSSSHPKNRSLKNYCKVAYDQGWCSEMCGNKQPINCFDMELVSCGEVMCVYKAKDGSIVFNWRK